MRKISIAVVMLSCLLAQAPTVSAVTVTYSKYQIQFSPNTTGSTNCIKQLPPLYFSQAKSSRQTAAVLRIEQPSAYTAMHVKQRDVSQPQTIRFTDEVWLSGLASPILLTGFTDRITANSYGQWSYNQGQCAGTFSMTRLSTRR